MGDCGHVDFGARQWKFVAQLGEDFAGLIRQRQSAVVLAQQRERLKRDAHRARRFDLIAHLLKQLQGLFMQGRRFLVPAHHVKDVCLRPQAQTQRKRVFDFRGDGGGAFREIQGFLHVHADSFPNDLAQLLDYTGAKQGAVPGQERFPECFTRELSEFREEFFGGLGWFLPFQWKPDFSNCDFILSRHRPRIKPIDPVAIPRLLATSV